MGLGFGAMLTEGERRPVSDHGDENQTTKPFNFQLSRKKRRDKKKMDKSATQPNAAL
jgi:hypothetical protein